MSTQSHTKAFARRRLFTKDLKLMMYGFGDHPNAAPDTVNVMEDLVVDYINNMCLEAAKVSEKRGKVRVDDFKHALRRDTKKLARVEELLVMADTIKKAKQIFDPQAMAFSEEGGDNGSASGDKAKD